MFLFARKNQLFISASAALLFGCLIAYAIHHGTFFQFSTLDQEIQTTDILETAQLTPEIEIRKSEHTIPKGSTVSTALRSAGLDHQSIHQITTAAESVKSLRQVPANIEFEISWKDIPETTAVAVDFYLSPTTELSIRFENAWVAKLVERPITIKTETFVGTVRSSLWDSAVEAGMDPQLIVDLATIFAWQIDFNREVRPDDRWRIVVERRYVNDEAIGWGHILAAEYENVGDRLTAVRFAGRDGERPSYFAPDGSSLKRMFLKSPIKFGRVSSRFKAQRLHPILGVNIPHNGVDYAAPTGTPIMAVGKGIVEFAGRNGGSGIMVKIRHNATYTTAYLHLSRIAKGFKKGSRIEQGDILGYVGATGLATGPHLHFAFYEGGRFVDPLGRKFPSADPVPSEQMELFAKVSARLLGGLPAWQLAKGVEAENKDS